MDEKPSAPKDAKNREPLDETSLDREPVFHYSRAHRLAKASPALRAFNEDGPPKRSQGFNTLLSNRSHRFGLISIALLILFAGFMSRFTREKYLPVLGGNTIAYAAVQKKEGVEFTIKKTIKKKADDPYTGPVNIAITAAPLKKKGADGAGSFEAAASRKTDPVEFQRIDFTLRPEETFSLFIPFTASRFLVVMVAAASEGEEYVDFKVIPK
ncbi:MAG: hypothetical protein LBD24_05590 [Spirochaetaceae bacterium]|jgi:hypothetical protein|nr:hypothetical protein [Spirochaetaceae bacterium]